MKKILAWLLLGLLVLTACGAPQPSDDSEDISAILTESEEDPEVEESEAEEEPTAVAEEAPAVVEEEEAEPEEPAAEAQEESETVAEEPPAASVNFPATTAEEANIVREVDYFKGAEEPLVTIIEYGDFQ